MGTTGQASLWPNLHEKLMDDLGDLHAKTGPWHVVFFTGDLTQRGTKTEFDRLEAEVFAPLWAHMQQLGSDPRLLAVPGNHDLVRPDTTKPTAALRQLLRDTGFAEISDEFFDDPVGEYRTIVNSAFTNFTNWWHTTPYRFANARDGVLPGDFSASLSIGDKQIGVIGLNTAFLQLSAGDYSEKLAIDLKQFHGTVSGGPFSDGPSWTQQHDISLLLTHHGPDWLQESIRNQVYPEINPAGRFAVHLFGHMHNNVARGSRSMGGATLWQWQGSSLFSVEKFGDPPRGDRRHGYSAGTIDFDSQAAHLRHWPRKAIFDSLNGWSYVPDPAGCRLLGDGGSESETLTFGSRARKRIAAPAPSPSDHDFSITERQALANYLQAARKSWDIVDLAGLPEDDRHLAMQQFLLRQLFVPLRLTVEAPAQEEFTAEAIETLEDRRLERRSLEAGRKQAALGDPATATRFSIGERLAKLSTPSSSGRRKLKRSRSIQVAAPTPRIVVLGDPGGGKTTLLRWLATALLMRLARDPDLSRLPDGETLPRGDWLPLLIRCRDLDKAKIQNGQVAVQDVLRQTLTKLELRAVDVETLVEALRRSLERGKILLMVDGLDEITDPQLRSQFCAWIETVAAQFPTPLIVTSRIVGYREMKRRLRGEFEHTSLVDLSPDDKDEFVRRWCEVTIPDPTRRRAEGEKLNEAIHGRSSDRIERLTGNPMLLTTLALVQRKVGKLPSRRHKLYWEAVGVLLNWRADVDQPLDADEALPQLEYIAYTMCDKGIQRMRRDNLLRLLDDVRREYPHIRPVQRQTPEAFLAQLERRTGLLVETGYEHRDGRPVPVYEFRHLTFQEYLAALALIEGRFPGHDPRNSLAQRVAPLAGRLVEVKDELVKELQVSENWREALRLCVSCANDDDVDSTLRAILIGPSDCKGLREQHVPISDAREARPRAILAALCLADEPNVSQPTALTVVKTFVAQVGRPDGSGRIRTGLDRAVMDLERSVWRDSLRTALLQEFQRRSTAQRSRVGGLIGMLEDLNLPDSDAGAREHWQRSCAEIIAGHDKEAAIVAALAIMNAAFRELIEANELVVNGLIRMLSGDAPAAHAASWALRWLVWDRRGRTPGRTSRPRKGRWIPSEDQLRRVVTVLSQPNVDGEVARWLCDVLGSTRDPATVPVLAQIGRHDYPSARESAISALTNIPHSAAVSELRNHLDDESRSIRNTVIGGLISTASEITKKLLSEDFDGMVPWRDPRDVIDDAVIEAAACKLKMTRTKVLKHYQEIASRFSLKINVRTA